MRFAQFYNKTSNFLIPEQRIEMIKEAFDKLKEGKCKVTGSKQIKEHFMKFFEKLEEPNSWNIQAQLGYGSGSGFSAGISITATFTKEAEAQDEDLPEIIEIEENGLKSKSINIPRLAMEFVNKKGKLIKLYISKISTKNGDIYLPTRTPGKFKNFARQVLAGKVKFE